MQETAQALGAQARRTLDTVVREILNAGTNVQYAEGQVTSRDALTSSHKLTMKAVKMAVRTLGRSMLVRRGVPVGIPAAFTEVWHSSQAQELAARQAQQAAAFPG